MMTDLENVMKTYSGRRVLMDILTTCGTYQASTSSDPVPASFVNGRRSIGIWLLSQIDQIKGDGDSSDGLSLEMLMRREAKSRENKGRDAPQEMDYYY